MFLPVNPSLHQAPTYHLSPSSAKETSDFYEDLEIITEVISHQASKLFQSEVDQFTCFVLQNSIESLKNNQEYELELMMCGLYIKNYLGHSSATAAWKIRLMSGLFDARSKYPSQKKRIDSLRGKLGQALLSRKTAYRLKPIDLKDFSQLLNWLYATGEYSHQVKRLRNWEKFLKTLQEDEVKAFLEKCEHFSRFFESYASMLLSRYTYKVNDFRNLAEKTYRKREDYFLATKPESEYHLNMVGAAIMNKALKKRFEKAENKIFVAPACMRSFGPSHCQGVPQDGATRCISCNSLCKLGQTARMLNEMNVATFVVPHSSEFSKFLQKWKNQNHTAIIATACVLNLMEGGYEVSRLNIPSQCLYLDYSACKNHWDSKGIPTTVNPEQLKKLATRQKAEYQASMNAQIQENSFVNAYMSTASSNWFAL